MAVRAHLIICESSTNLEGVDFRGPQMTSKLTIRKGNIEIVHNTKLTCHGYGWFVGRRLAKMGSRRVGDISTKAGADLGRVQSSRT